MAGFINLNHLRIHLLNLPREHVVITRGPLARSVTKLSLPCLQPCAVTTFIRFLNSFSSLTDLGAGFPAVPSESLVYNGQVLPPPRSTPICSLKHLCFNMVPGIGRLIEWYIREGCFLASLRKLTLAWLEPYEDNGPCFDGLPDLLDHCADTLEDLSLWIDLEESRAIAKISQIGMLWYVHL